MSVPSQSVPPKPPRPSAAGQPLLPIGGTRGSQALPPEAAGPTTRPPEGLTRGSEQPGAEGTTYRAKRRPGLTGPGVAVITTATALVFGVLSSVVTGGLGWLFGVPLVLVTAYCAWEVREGDRRSALAAPPLTLLVVAVVSTLLADGWAGVLQLAASVFSVLVNAAPMLVLAEAGVVVTLVVRRWRAKQH